MESYMVTKVSARRSKPKFFNNLEEALANAENKSKKNKAEYCVSKAYKKVNGTTYYMKYAVYNLGKRIL